METSNVVQAVLALILVVALIGICAVVGKRFVLDKNMLKNGQKKRMKIDEVLYLDARRKLVLVKKDEEEFLIMLSATGETVVSGSKKSK